MSERISIEQWPARLQALAPPKPCHGHGTAFRVNQAIVLRETDSTQDAARRLNARPGAVIVTWRQTAGRGRLGRAWADTGEDGVAMTIVMERGPAERLAMVGAITAALAAESVLKRSVGIKWPNDILVDGKKLAGVLVEQFDDTALLGIGINVYQQSWPDELADRAVSVAQLGAKVDRIEVLEGLLRLFAQAILLDDAALSAEFAKRDVLSGWRATFRSAGQVIDGIVLEIAPMKGLLIESDGGRQWLNAATTTLVGCADGVALGREFTSAASKMDATSPTESGPALAPQ